MDATSVVSIGLHLGIPGFAFADLYRPDRLRDLHEWFLEEVQAADPALLARWDLYARDPGGASNPVEVSALLVELAPHVSRFVTRLFGIGSDSARSAAETRALDDLFRFKVDFVRRRVLPLLKGGAPPPVAVEDEAIAQRLLASADGADDELRLARAGCALLDREAALGSGADAAARALVQAEMDALKRSVAARIDDPACRGWVVFRFPETLDYLNLVPSERSDARLPDRLAGPPSRLRLRDGFGLTDPRMGPREVLSEVHYCILCHERDKDSCSKGLRDKDGSFARNPLGIELAGCPLDEKISEMHQLRKHGDAIGALALVTVDNPLCAGTGHRICNDCMKACIYQKQEPVNIPQVETGVLTDVLRLPWGVEIYGLLTRWNPLNVRRPYALPYNGKNVLIVGLGPAGYTLAHYLVNEGFGVVAIDGLKIEPLPDVLTGAGGERLPEPVRDWSALYTSLEERALAGFGGVSEYGITVRWDKNFLTLLHLLLARRDRLRIYGGIRFGGTMPIEDAWAHGFDHVAIAAGAGRPTIIDIKNNLIRGVRKASDFLMALQLTGAFKREALANLQVRLPAVVIGGGLTAIDAATELLAYYPVQVEKILDRYEALVASLGEEAVRARYDAEERAHLDEFLTHGRAVRTERARAAEAGGPPDLVRLVRAWGGVSMVYRKRLQDSPAYRLNHEEVVKALEEGITIVENLDPEEAVPDELGHVRAVRFRRQVQQDGRWTESGEIVELPAASLLVAAGTAPNITYEKEYAGTFALDSRGRFFLPHAVERGPDGRFTLNPAADGVFTSYERDGRLVSYYGDNHPRYNGNVVKAMASARDGHRQVRALFADDLARLDPTRQPARDAAWRQLVGRLDKDLLAEVVEVVRLAPNIVEVVVRAPAAARHFHPGQFFRLQNYEADALVVSANGHRIQLLMEGIALTGAWVDPDQGLLSMITLEMGVSSRLCAYLRPGQRVVVMGPTGAPTEIPAGERVLLAGGGLGNAVLFSIARALRERDNRVLYFAGYRRGEDLFKREEIERATDQVIWSTDTGAPIAPARAQDRHFRGNIVEAMVAYVRGELGPAQVPLDKVDRIIAIGSDRMMAAIKAARSSVLEPFLKREHVAIASINSPMQCMMKEVCAQCLQKHVDPKTGRETIIFSCFNQDQYMDRVDFFNLNARLRQNTVQEKLSGLWLDQALSGLQAPHV